MDVTAARNVIDELEQVRQATRRDRRPSSVPLLVFGVLTLFYALALPMGPYRSLYWLMAAPAGFAVVAWYYRRQGEVVGVGSSARTYVWWAVGILAALASLPFLVILGGPFAVLTNRAYEVAGWVGYSNEHGSSYFPWDSSLVAALLGLMLVGAGLVALRHEAGTGRRAKA